MTEDEQMTLQSFHSGQMPERHSKELGSDSEEGKSLKLSSRMKRPPFSDDITETEEESEGGGFNREKIEDAGAESTPSEKEALDELETLGKLYLHQRQSDGNFNGNLFIKCDDDCPVNGEMSVREISQIVINQSLAMESEDDESSQIPTPPITLRTAVQAHELLQRFYRENKKEWLPGLTVQEVEHQLTVETLQCMRHPSIESFMSKKREQEE
jgi:hypothetical protein